MRKYRAPVLRNEKWTHERFGILFEAYDKHAIGWEGEMEIGRPR